MRKTANSTEKSCWYRKGNWTGVGKDLGNKKGIFGCQVLFIYIMLVILSITVLGFHFGFFSWNLTYNYICIWMCVLCAISYVFSDMETYGQVNFSSGRYFSGNSKDLGSLLPFDAGFEVQNKKNFLIFLAWRCDFSCCLYIWFDNSKLQNWCLIYLYIALWFQAVGIIVAVGDSVTNLRIGSPAAVMTYGSYAEFTMVR